MFRKFIEIAREPSNNSARPFHAERQTSPNGFAAEYARHERAIAIDDGCTDGNCLSHCQNTGARTMSERGRAVP